MLTGGFGFATSTSLHNGSWAVTLLDVIANFCLLFVGPKSSPCLSIFRRLGSVWENKKKINGEYFDETFNG